MSNRHCRTALGLALCLLFAAGTALRAGGPASDSPAAGSRPGGDATAGSKPLRVVVFYSPTCHGCRRLEKALAAGEKRWGGRISVERRHLVDSDAFAALIAYEKHYGSKGRETVKGFVGGRHVAGVSRIVRRLDGIIAEELARGSATFVPGGSDGKEPGKGEGEIAPGIVERFGGFSAGMVVLAGLLDGINPCAFTTIVFLLSMLAYLGRSRRQLATVGAAFTAAVFVTYFLLGLGLFGAIKTFSVSHGISAALAYVVAGLVFVLAGWSLVDFIRYVRTGDVRKVTLGLPRSVKGAIHKVIRVGLSTRWLVVGSVGVGFLVALLESLCTGQVYLPVIVIVSRDPGLRAAAVGYLLLYNLMFIAPLVVILLVAYFGVRSDRLGDFLRRHLAALKLALAVLFATLGVVVLATV